MLNHIFLELKQMTDEIVPISAAERKQRLEKVKRLMAEENISGLFLEPGSSMFYFLGIQGNPNKRLLAAIIPVRGETAYICPQLEEPSFINKINPDADLRIWAEHENPYEYVKTLLNDSGVTEKLAIEENVRFFVADGIRKACPEIELISATSVIAQCRGMKSKAEVALMQRAADITIEAFKATFLNLDKGMNSIDISTLCRDAHNALGVTGFAFCLLGESSAFPHGDGKRRLLKEGDIILIDGGCRVDGYYSDITRTIVFGEPNARQREIWNLEKQAQEAAFDAAQIGNFCEDVDAAARKVIVDAGFGPEYALPGLPHRTGHGIGLDGHEDYYIVKGNKKRLSPGMCFSNEPTICIPGEFGVRLEDCICMTDDGPKYFTLPSPAINQPFA